ncbi:MAG: Hexaprenyldihydroxybenzoate methyltransferase, mitochondrial [Claussenomyces sp. TS43310]|nr:MAG: Hexaprenyldihydroxybenzoate methyltransferase, mitochondrial [Claussenomyces sp. TS43310]
MLCAPPHKISIVLRTAPRFVRLPTRSYPQCRTQSSSVSAEEISHFNGLASSWWEPHGSSRLLHLMNPLRHDFIRICHASQRNPPSPTAPLTYLDIGCGGGIFAESAARLPHTKSVTAIDPSPKVLSIAKGHARRDPGLASKLHYANASIEGMPKPDSRTDRYDIVSLFEVIEHVTDPSRFLDHVVEQLKPGGWLIMSTIARHWMSYFTTKVVAEDLVGIVPQGTHDWQKYINVDELKDWFARKGGFNSPTCRGLIYVPGVGWREVSNGQTFGNYFFGIRKDE